MGRGPGERRRPPDRLPWARPLGGCALALSVVGFAIPAVAHRLPKPPVVELLAAVDGPRDFRERLVTVRILDPLTGAPLDLDEEVYATPLLPSGDVAAGGFRLRVGRVPGIFSGAVRFPALGQWRMRVTIEGVDPTGTTFQVEVVPPVGRQGPVARPVGPIEQPELWDWYLVRPLVRQWGHLLGFALWLGGILWALNTPPGGPLRPMTFIWGGLLLTHLTALEKMDISTPPFAAVPYIWNLDRIRHVPFARQYALLLAAKQGLALVGLGLGVGMTVRLWRDRNAKAGPDLRAVRPALWASLLVALAIGALAVSLDMLHKVVDHYLR